MLFKQINRYRVDASYDCRFARIHKKLPRPIYPMGTHNKPLNKFLVCLY